MTGPASVAARVVGLAAATALAAVAAAVTAVYAPIDTLRWAAVPAGAAAALAAILAVVLHRAHHVQPTRADATPPRALRRPSTNDPLWLSLVEDVVELYDELAERGRTMPAPARAIADHVCARITEVLESADVDVTAADRRDTASVGFAVGRRVLRRADSRFPPAGRRV